MFCEQCGKKINDDVKFCKYCGSPTGGAAELKREEKLPKREKKEKSEKAVSGGSNKILWGILVVVVLAVLGYVGGMLLGLGKSDISFESSSSVSDTIPDPEYYFGLTDEHNQKNDLWRYMQLKSEENLKTVAEDYIALLQSGKYPFELSSKEVEENEDFECKFIYTGSAAIPDKTSFQIKVEYIGPRDHKVDDNRDMVWVTIGNYEHFELVKAERSEQAESLAAAERQYAAAKEKQKVSAEPPANSVVEKQEEPTSTVVVEDEPEEEDFFETCKTCFGNGKCSWCNGTGHKTKFQAGIGHVEQTCTGCFGDGDCSSCGGSGMKRDT